MDAIECINTRMSMRKFTKDPVPAEVLTEIVAAAQRSPSYKNSQPWEVIVVSGAKKFELTDLLTNALQDGQALDPDLPEPKPSDWPPVIAGRIDALLSAKLKHMGIDKPDPSLLPKIKIANFRFYGAPHAIYLYQDGSLPEWSILDIGMFAQSLMLAAHAKGLGTVPQAFVTEYASIVKNCLGIPADKRLVLGFSVGYPITDHPANTYFTERVATADILKFVE